MPNLTVDYRIQLNIPDDIDFIIYPILETNIFDLSEFTNTIDFNNHSLIVLWGLGMRISVDDFRITHFNDIYNSVKNPMLLVNTGHYPINNLIKFPYVEINFFQYISKQTKFDPPIQIRKNKKFIFTSTKDYIRRRFILHTLFEFRNQGHISYKCINRDLTTDVANVEHIRQISESIADQIPVLGFDDSIEFTDLPMDKVNDCYLSIITETYYNKVIFLTEKVFNAMLFRHFFIYQGPPHSLKRLKELGFKTFDHIINEDYDTIDDDAKRLYAVTAEIRKFLNKSLDELEQLYIDNLDILEHNRLLVQRTEINLQLVDAMRNAILNRDIS